MVLRQGCVKSARHTEIRFSFFIGLLYDTYRRLKNNIIMIFGVDVGIIL
jgi:hypothetical protein